MSKETWHWTKITTLVLAVFACVACGGASDDSSTVEETTDTGETQAAMEGDLCGRCTAQDLCYGVSSGQMSACVAECKKMFCGSVAPLMEVEN